MKLLTKGRTEFQRFDNSMWKILSVSHEELQRRLESEEKAKARNKKRKPSKTSAVSLAPDGVS